MKLHILFSGISDPKFRVAVLVLDNGIMLHFITFLFTSTNYFKNETDLLLFQTVRNHFIILLFLQLRKLFHLF